MDRARFAETLVADAPDAIVYADAEGLIRFWNAAAERMFGYASDEAIGRSLDLIIPDGLRQRHWTGYHKTMATGETRYGANDLLSVPAVRKDGSRLSVEFTILPFRGEDGKMAGIAAILRDVTKRFEELKALRQQLAQKA